MLTPAELKDIVTDPRTIITKLDDYIIGQDAAKRALSLMMLSRSLMVLSKFGIIDKSVPIQKSNVLLVGPSGCGKTSLVKALSEVADLPISVFDITSVTSAGYIGSKVEDILARYIDESFEFWGNRIKDFRTKFQSVMFEPTEDILVGLLETGVIYIDEIDKIHCKTESGVDVGGDAVQNELLKFLEGCVISLTSHSSSASRRPARIPELNTKDIFFILGGAFKGIDDIVSKRVNSNAGIGFSSTLSTDKDRNAKADYFKLISSQDLIDYGFKPEFVGRIPLRACLSPITKQILMDIILKTKNSCFSQYKDMLALFGVTLEIEREAVELIAEQSMDLKIGARAIQNIFFHVLSDHVLGVYDITDTKVVITRDLVLSRGTLNEV
jgi:ATP-dependent Clp protease ATP-binding subunit ClpX